MMPQRKVKQAKKDDEPDEHKKSKKGKVVKPARTVGMGRGHDDDDCGYPHLDIEEGSLMQAKPMKMQKIDQASREHGGPRSLSSEDPLMPCLPLLTMEWRTPKAPSLTSQPNPGSLRRRTPHPPSTSTI